MENKILKQMRFEAEEIFRRSVEAVNPYDAVRRFVRVDGDYLIAGTEDQPAVELDLNGFDRVFLVGGGK
ncbi:MAG: DUF4147 domain-containing protein, partial [Desulfobacteraceae bacterium]|nr:DUF4147 domain-containing protein [Desulfobacteraceae bacterium]